MTYLNGCAMGGPNLLGYGAEEVPTLIQFQALVNPELPEKSQEK